MMHRNVHRAQHCNLLRKGSKPRRPGESLEGAARIMSVFRKCLPLRIGYKRFEAKRVGQLRDLDIVIPSRHEAVRMAGERAPATVECEDTELELVVVSERV